MLMKGYRIYATLTHVVCTVNGGINSRLPKATNNPDAQEAWIERKHEEMQEMGYKLVRK